jgi:hypothetical protein
VITQLLFELPPCLFEVPPCLGTAAGAAWAALTRSDVDPRIKSLVLCSISLLHLVLCHAEKCRDVPACTGRENVCRMMSAATGLCRDSRANTE